MRPGEAISRRGSICPRCTPAGLSTQLWLLDPRAHVRPRYVEAINAASFTERSQLLQPTPTTRGGGGGACSLQVVVPEIFSPETRSPAKLTKNPSAPSRLSFEC